MNEWKANLSMILTWFCGFKYKEIRNDDIKIHLLEIDYVTKRQTLQTYVLAIHLLTKTFFPLHLVISEGRVT